MLDTRIAHQISIEQTRISSDLGKLYIKKAQTEAELEEIKANITKGAGMMIAYKEVEGMLIKQWEAKKKEEEEARAKEICEK